jgi:uncharacterized protein (TIGR02118 family)
VIKLIVLIKRREDLTIEEFRDYYENRHAPLFQRTISREVRDAVKLYVQNHAVPMEQRTNPPYDCVTEFGFDDTAGLTLWTQWYRGEEGKVLRDDEENFMDLRRRLVILTTEHDIGANP